MYGTRSGRRTKNLALCRVKISLKLSLFYLHVFHRLRVLLLFTFVTCSAFISQAQRVPVLDQIDLPHNYYFRELYLHPSDKWAIFGVLDQRWESLLIYSMAGSLWIQEVGAETAYSINRWSRI